MGTMDGLLWLLIFLGGGVVLSSVTLFLTLTVFVLAWHTLTGILGVTWGRTRKKHNIQSAPIHETTNPLSSSSPT